MMRGLTLLCSALGVLATSGAAAAAEGAAPPPKEAPAPAPAPAAKTAPAPAKAAVVPSIAKGSKEVSVSLIFQDTEDTSSITGVVGFGIFVTDNIEVRGSGFLSVTDPDAGDLTSLGLFLAQGLYYFNPKDQTVFYAGVGFGVGGFDSGPIEDSVTVAMFLLGAKYFATANTTFFVEYNYLSLHSDDDTLHTHSILLGMSYFF